MKIFRLIGLFLVGSSTLFSCSNNEDERLSKEQEKNDQETYTISFDLRGEFISTSETPLGRVAEEPLKKIYGISVYSKKDDTNDSYKPYAKGVFDNIEDMNITLITGYRYKFVCTVVKEGLEQLFYTIGYSDGCYEYYAPFYNSIVNDKAYTKTALGNKFIISDYDLKGLGLGTTSISGSELDKASKYPKMDRFYGELSDYIPTKDGTVNIDLKRVAFGLKVIVKPSVDGKLYISTEPNLFSASIQEKDNVLEGQETIYTFPDVYNCWEKDDYFINCIVKLSWSRATGWQDLEPKNIKLKRNVMTTVTIDIKGTAIEYEDGSFGFKEDVPMKDENVEFVIQADGEIIETPVIPST